MHEIELGFIRQIHHFRTPFFDRIEKAFAFFDSQEFLFVVIPAVWVIAGSRTGLKLFYILSISALLNDLLKLLFSLPRPFQLDPALAVISIKNFGFPSGAAQTVILLSGILLGWRKNFWTLSLAFLYIASVSFSRVYLGAHFPSDILGGWVIGFGLWLFYAYGFPLLERCLQRIPVSFLFVLGLVIPLFFMYSLVGSLVIPICSVAIGVNVGLLISYLSCGDFSPAENYKQSLFRVLFAVVGTFLSYEASLMIVLPSITFTLFLRFFLVGLWLSVGSHWICRLTWIKKNAH